MPHSFDIDSLFASFCRALPGDLREAAETLPFRLGLVPKPGLAWSVTFKHDVTLQAPALVAEEMTVTERALESAVLAHMLAVIEAFGTDRIADGQVADAPELRRVLEHAREARNRALIGIGGIDGGALAAAADRRTLEAIGAERRLFARARPVSFAAYEAVSAGKQAVGFPASLVLARSCGWPPEKLEILESTLMGVWLGLQFRDDVVDWEDDVERGGAWALLLARHHARELSPTFPADEARTLVFSSGVLAEMLARSAQRFRAAAAGAAALGASELAAWASHCEHDADVARQREATHPGSLGRAVKLGPWALEVLG